MTYTCSVRRRTRRLSAAADRNDVCESLANAAVTLNTMTDKGNIPMAQRLLLFLLTCGLEFGRLSFAKVNFGNPLVVGEECVCVK